jgi:hypothetical protein
MDLCHFRLRAAGDGSPPDVSAMLKDYPLATRLGPFRSWGRQARRLP